MKKITLLISLLVCLFLNASPNAETAFNNNTIQRVRVDFTSSNGYVRHLLLGFTSNNTATDGFDYGYDAINIEDFPNDMNWMIEDERYIVQGVGSFATTKYYPLGLFLSDTGEIQISLNALENFNEEVPVYVYDSELNTYTQINNQNFSYYIDSGEYINRFYITFSIDLDIESNGNGTALSVNDEVYNNSKIKYYSNSNELHVIASEMISSIVIFDLNGKKVNTFSFVSTSDIRLTLKEKNSGMFIVSVNTTSESFNKLIHL